MTTKQPLQQFWLYESTLLNLTLDEIICLKCTKCKLAYLLSLVVTPATEFSAQLARISHTLGVIFPDRASDTQEPRVIKLHVDVPLTCKLHVNVCTRLSSRFLQFSVGANPYRLDDNQWCNFVWLWVLVPISHDVSNVIHRWWCRGNSFIGYCV